MTRTLENEPPDRIQLHLVLAYRIEVRRHRRVRRYLECGYRILQLQRVTDREILVTLERNAAEPT